MHTSNVYKLYLAISAWHWAVYWSHSAEFIALRPRSHSSAAEVVLCKNFYWLIDWLGALFSPASAVLKVLIPCTLYVLALVFTLAWHLQRFILWIWDRRLCGPFGPLFFNRVAFWSLFSPYGRFLVAFGFLVAFWSLLVAFGRFWSLFDRSWLHFWALFGRLLWCRSLIHKKGGPKSYFTAVMNWRFKNLFEMSISRVQTTYLLLKGRYNNIYWIRQTCMRL